jgi:NAD(P)-dependent dehydrogenase (short-subunit alcohol dehydrogenase family)
MKPHLKNLSDQTVVITGASSGTGMATARLAARRGARVVLAARGAHGLRDAGDAIRADGGEVACVVADVAQEGDVRRIAEVALDRFGGVDTWVNNAGVSVYGRLEDVPIEDQRRVFETNYWGTVYGCRVALEHLRQRGGALINVGSILSERAFPLQGAYSASKHAIKGFTDALRMELMHDGAPVSVTLIKPAAIDTPYIYHARNYLPMRPQNPPPLYAPEVVARAILHAAEHPARESSRWAARAACWKRWITGCPASRIGSWRRFCPARSRAGSRPAHPRRRACMTLPARGGSAAARRGSCSSAAPTPPRRSTRLRRSGWP